MADEVFATKQELEDFRKEVRLWLSDMLQTIDLLKPPSIDDDFPPVPPKTSRKYQGEKVQLTIRVDKNLLDLLKAEADKQSGKNLSRHLDVILWKHFGRPKMSWETKKGKK